MQETSISVIDSKKELVSQYIQFRHRNKFSPSQDANLSKSEQVYQSILNKYAVECNKSLQEYDELTVQLFLERHCKQEGSWNVYLSTLRRFHAWLENRDKLIPRRKWKPPAFFEMLEWKSTKSWKYGPNDIWTEEEISVAIEACDHPRNKALIAMGYDLAARPVELLALRIRDIALKQNYAQVKLVDHSNPEGRTVPLTISFPYLLSWINVHPLKNEASAPLWVGTQGTPKRLGYTALYTLCAQTLKVKLCHVIKKPFNPYAMFCHSRLTNLVESGLSDYDLKLFRGWSLDSKMPKRYLQLTNRGLNK